MVCSTAILYRSKSRSITARRKCAGFLSFFTRDGLVVLKTGKYTSFQIKPSILDFGGVVVGSAQQMAFKILNTSRVMAKVHLDIVEDSAHPSCTVFKLDLIDASILPNEQLSVKVLYSPLSAGSFSAGQVVVTDSTQSGRSLICSGYALRPSVSISTNAVDFGSSPLGSSISNCLSILNMSEVHASFQFMISTSSTFKVHPKKGVIRPESNVSVCIEFRPQHTGNYYSRIFCAVHDQHMLYCDLIGSCFIEKVNFSTLQLTHVAKQRLFSIPGFQSSLLAAGTGENPVREASTSVFISANENGSDFCTCISGGSSVTREKKNSRFPCSLKNVSEEAHKAEIIWEEYFSGKNIELDFLEISPDVLNFGDIPYLQKSKNQEVLVRNLSETTVFCIWQNSDPSSLQESNQLIMTQAVQSKGPWVRKESQDAFQILPQEATILSMSSATFNVTFVPIKKDQFYAAMLDLRVVKISKENQLMVPYQASIQLSGSSFDSDQQKYLPQAYFFPSKVVFPPTLQGTYAYQTVALLNQGCTPVRFFFDTSNLSSLFSAKPMQGVVEEKNFQLIAVRFEAGSPCSHLVKLPCILNDNPNEKTLLTLISRSDNLQVELAEGNVIYFRPTNVGVASDRIITLRNISSISAVFTWTISGKNSNVFSFKPSGGIILGNQEVQVTCSFCPKFPMAYTADVSCLTAAMTEKFISIHKHGASVAGFCGGPEKGKITALFQGEGREASVKMEPQHLELGTIVVGFPECCKITISNISDDSVNYMLSFASLKETNDEAYKLKFDKCQGIIPSCSSIDINITFKPKIVSSFAVSIMCSVTGSIDMEGAATRQTPQCILSAKALLPSLCICGAMGEGLSQAQTWRMLHLDVIESALAETETQQNVGLKGYQDLFGPGETFGDQWNSALNFCFGRGHVASKPTVFILVLRTRNDLPVTWKIRLWNDKDVDLENWVEEPELSNKKEHIYMNVFEQSLIQVFPREGHLAPQEKVQIKFIYRHYVEGKHIFPAILHVKNGCALPLMFSGETVSRDLNFLSLEMTTFMLMPIAAGHENPPLQTFELRNDGDCELNYEVDLNPLKGLREENFGFEVLACLNPIGSIPPHETLLLNWRFQPIEIKCYAVNVFISVRNGEGVMLPIRGEGIGTDKAAPRNVKPSPEENSQSLHPLLTSCPWVGLPAMLSLEHLSYEHIQTLSEEERLVFVKNLSADSRVRFSWHCSYAADNCVHGHFSVMPSQGIIECGKSCMCKITFTAGVQPQCFETTLSCRVAEFITEHVDLDTKSPDDDESNEVIYAKDWERFGSTETFCKDKGHRENAVLSLTCSTNMKLPRLSAKGPLRFSTFATLKPLTDDEQGIRSEQTKKNRSVLYLGVSGSIHSVDTLQRGPGMFCSTKEQQKSNGFEGRILEEMLGEAIQEVMDTRLVESRLQNIKASFFEQYAKSLSVRGSNIEYLPSQTHSKATAFLSPCDDQHDTSGMEMVRHLETSVGMFELAKVMLELMLFEIVKEIYDSGICSLLPST